MAIKLTPGNLYFIRDIDYLTGEIGKYIKIGIVTKDRTTEARTKEHQTGNPRGIYPVDEIISVPFVERLETHLHYEFNERWISGEWFLLTDAELKTVVDRAKVLQAQQILDKPIIENALLKLHKATSNGKMKKATKEAKDLETQILILKGELNILDAKIEISKSAFYTLLGANGSIDKILNIKYTPSSLKFDEKAFAAAHPALFTKFTLPRDPSFKHTFNLTNISTTSLKTLDPTLYAQKSAIIKTKCTKAQLTGVQKRTKAIEKMHAEHLVLMKDSKLKEFELEILEYRLQKLVGAYDGIDGICTWKRYYAPQTDAFNASAFKEKHPKLYETFVTKPSSESFAMEVEKGRAYKPR
jgi:hypothetical protein